MLSLLSRIAMGGDARQPIAAVPNLQALVPASPEALGRLREVVHEVNAGGGTYHCLDFGDGLTIAGDYDLRRYLHLYRLPADLSGKTVLDVGSASGFFALECARRGAKVVAVDVQERPLLARLAPLLAADVTYVQRSVYDLDPAAQVFDLVVCGSLLLHLPDPLGAIRRLRGVCAGAAIVATACTKYSPLTSRPICEFRGRQAADGDYHHWWEIGAAALRAMLLSAGFSEVCNRRHFMLSSEPRRTRFDTPHVVVTARV
jgi:SAM-dependent methyltransferase